MKKIYTHKDLMQYHRDNCGKCEAEMHPDYFIVTCDKCTGEKKDKKKEIRKDTIDEIDTNGNDRLTNKEIKDWVNKDK